MYVIGMNVKTFKFVRLGGLSPVKQKERFVSDKILQSTEYRTYHRPPCRKGVYAFFPDLIEMFLVAWKIYSTDKDGNYSIKKEFEHSRKFEYSGKVWTHMFINHPEITYYRRRDSWFETDTDSLELLLRLYKRQLSKEISKEFHDFGSCKSFDDFNRMWKNYSRDCFEVFIERPH